MLTDGPLTITDPTWDGGPAKGPIAKVFVPLIRDERDLPFVRLALLMTALLLPMAVAMFIPGVFRWWMAPVYWVVYAWFMGPFVLMLHNVSHRALFDKQHAMLNRYIPWVVGSLMGQSPETYFAHHLGMHHIENNLEADLSSTLRFKRDSFLHFLRYFGRFLFLGDYEIVRYFQKRKRKKMLRRFIVGELSYFALGTAMFFVNWQAALVVFGVPVLFTRLTLMMGNWAQHAFVDPSDPTNDFKTVVTFINSGYNHKCFNDGYHLGHHLKASRHWLDHPAEFLAQRERMIAEDSLVFRKIDYFMIFVLLMFKRYKTLARFYVNLDPDNPKSEAEIIALLKRRVQPIRLPAAPQEATTLAAA